MTAPPKREWPAGKVYAGFCLLCGSDLWVARKYRKCGLDDPEVFFPESNTHRCEPGRILKEEGHEAYKAYQAAEDAKYETELLRKYPTFDDARRDAEQRLRALGKRPREQRRKRAEKLKLAKLLSGIFHSDMADYSDDDLLVWFLTNRKRD
jgi:hypothetical protein